MNNDVETVSFDLINKIHGHINRTEKKIKLLNNLQKWLTLTSALDTLEDTSWAVEYYLETEYPSSKKGAYLFTYGLCQSLFVQMDAVNSISEGLFGKLVKFDIQYPNAYNVRQMRDDVTGHPTNRGKIFHIYLAQYSLSKDSFHYTKENGKNGESEYIDVDVKAAINETAKCVNSILRDALENLETEFKEYINSHKNRKMVSIFNNLIYAQQKVFQNDYLAQSQYESTKNMVERCEKELKLRYGSIDELDSYKYLLDNIHETYDLIDKVVPDVPEKSRKKMKKHLLQALFHDLEELQSCCKETDDYFENGGKEKLEDMESNLPKVIILNDIGTEIVQNKTTSVTSDSD